MASVPMGNGHDTGQASAIKPRRSRKVDPPPEQHTQLVVNTPPAISINLGFTTAQIAAGFATLLTLIGSGAFAGWLFIPAKDTDLQALKAVVELIRTDQLAQKTALGQVSATLDGLVRSVDDLRTQRVAVPRPTAKPRAVTP